MTNARTRNVVEARPSTRSRAAAGFTLVELLVVIGIIALLISILLPTLSRVRHMTNKVSCLNNLRQLHMATTMYANDNDSAFPYRGDLSPSPPHALAHMNFVPEDEKDEEFPSPRDMRGYWLTYLDGHEVGEPSPVFYCPSVNEPALFCHPGTSWPGYGPDRALASGFYLTTYGYYGNYDWEAKNKGSDSSLRWDPYMSARGEYAERRPVPRKLSDHPTLTLFADILENKAISGGPPSNWWYLNHTEHGALQFSDIPPEGIQAVTLDGSARWYRFNENLVDSELEPIMNAIFSSPGFFWPKPKID